VHYWYEVLWKIARWQQKKYGTSKTKQALTSVFVDQTVGVAVFFFPILLCIRASRSSCWYADADMGNCNNQSSERINGSFVGAISDMANHQLHQFFSRPGKFKSSIQ